MIVFTSLLAIIDKVIIIPLAVVYGLCMAVLSICKAITSLLLIVYSFLLMVYGLYMGYKGWEAFSRTSKLDLSYAQQTLELLRAQGDNTLISLLLTWLSLFTLWIVTHYR